MSNLKTLADIEDHGICHAVDLREEAKKWVAELQLHGVQLSQEFRMYTMSNWIEFFFNIKEE